MRRAPCPVPAARARAFLPDGSHEIAWSPHDVSVADEELAWIATEAGEGLRDRITSALTLGPQPHAYRRIKETDAGRKVLAVKEWRARFRVEEEARRIVVERIASGYRVRDLAEGHEPVHLLHRAFVERFGSA